MPRQTAARKATTTVRQAASTPEPVGSTILKFVEELPPSRKLGREASAFMEEAAELRAHKGKWAVLKTFDKPSGAGSLASAVKNGKYAAFAPQGAYEAVSRTTDDGKGVVYARFIG